MKKFIKEELCEGVYLMCGYSKGGNLYYCIIKDKRYGNNDIMFLARYQFAMILEKRFNSYCIHSFVNDGWCSSDYYTEFQSVIDVLDSEFPMEVK